MLLNEVDDVSIDQFILLESKKYQYHINNMKLVRVFVTLFCLISILFIIYDALLYQINPHFGNAAAKKIFNSPHKSIFAIEKSDDDNFMGPYRQNQQDDSFRQFITDQQLYFDTIVSFHAPWCKKCSQMRNIIFNVSSEVDGDFLLRCLLVAYDGNQLTELEKQNFEPILFWKQETQNPFVYRGQASVHEVMKWLKKVSSNQFSHPNYRYFGERTTKRIVKWLNRCLSYPFSHKLYAYSGQMTINCLARTLKRYIPFIGNETVLQDQIQPDYYINYDQNEKQFENNL